MLSYVSIKFRGFNVVGLTYKIVFCLSVRLLVCYSCNLLFYLLSKSRSIRDSPKWFFKSKKKIIIEKLSGKKNQIAMFLGNHFQLTYQIWKTIAISNYCIHNFFINPKIVWKSKNHRQIQKKNLEIPKNSQKFPLFAILKWRMNARKDVRKSILCRAAMQGKSGHVNH